VSLIPQALKGELPKSDDSKAEWGWGAHNWDRDWDRRRHRHGKREPSVESAVTSFFTGIGFIFVALAVLLYAPAGANWWWAFLIPAFATIGQGVGQYLRWKELQRQQISPVQPVVYSAPAQPPTLSAPTTSELVKPPSVTEHTTKHLNKEKQREK
jgi:hypothetical protein